MLFSYNQIVGIIRGMRGIFTEESTVKKIEAEHKMIMNGIKRNKPETIKKAFKKKRKVSAIASSDAAVEDSDDLINTTTGSFKSNMSKICTCTFHSLNELQKYEQ